MNLDHFVVYTDGASRKDRRGGWGFAIWYDDCWWEECGGEHDTTNNRMELQGAISALLLIDSMVAPDRATVELWTDSQYVLKGATEYIDGWKFRGWRTSGNEPVKNKDLWELLDEVHARHTVDWRWVKGHTGDEGNERADRLATRGVPAAHTSQGQSPAHPRTARVSMRRRPV